MCALWCLSEAQQCLVRCGQLSQRCRHGDALCLYGQLVAAAEDLLEQGQLEDVKGWAQLLHNAARALSGVLAFRLALQCLRLSLRCGALADGAEELRVKVLSVAVGTCLHLGDCSQAATLLGQHADLATGSMGHTVLGLHLELATAQLEGAMATSAKTTLTTAMQLWEQWQEFRLEDLMEVEGCGGLDPAHCNPLPPCPEEVLLLAARLQAALGYCCLLGQEDEALRHLEEAAAHWRSLTWHPTDAGTVLNTLRHVLEARFRAGDFDCSLEMEELVALHRHRSWLGLSMGAAEALTYLGTVAFHRESELTAIQLFQQALSLYRSATPQEATHEDICKLLRFVGVACYNGRQFDSAARAYHECLMLLETHPVAGDTGHLSRVAECCASLGFCYSRLRQFEHMLKFYERALELARCLSYEDVQLIETNIGSLYHVRAVRQELSGAHKEAQQDYERAEQAFQRALSYSWKSFPYINHGYYLLCRSRHKAASEALQQGYLNGVIDKDTVEFDHTEDPILLPDLRHELVGRQEIRVPAAIIALYLKTRALLGQGDSVGAQQTADQLQHEVQATRFSSYYIEGYGESRMHALCLSLLGYVYRELQLHRKALDAFQEASDACEGYTAAQENIAKQQQFLGQDRHVGFQKSLNCHASGNS